jgi:hypothetical protein
MAVRNDPLNSIWGAAKLTNSIDDAQRRLRISIKSLSISLIGVAAGITLATAPTYAQQYEVHAPTTVAKILSPSLIQGDHFKTRDRVLAYDFMYHFTVDSDFAVFEVTGEGALKKLVREISAIAALKNISTAEAVGASAKKAAKAPILFAENLVTHPVDTVSGLPKGVSYIFGNVKEGVSMEHDPSEDSRVKQALLVSSWKRDFAWKNGIDVYSSNAVLQKELNRVGWAAALTSLSISAATMAGGTAVTVMSNMRLADSVGKALKEEPPARLRLINLEKLKQMGVSDALADRYLDHLAFTPRHDTVIVESLTQMEPTRGRPAFMQHILAAKDEVGANFFQQMAETMLGYHNTVSPLDEIIVVDGMVIAQARSGNTLVPFPLDRGVWTARAQKILEGIKASREAAGFKGTIDIWITGTVSAMARQQLANRGFSVAENVDDRIGFLY